MSDPSLPRERDVLALAARLRKRGVSADMFLHGSSAIVSEQSRELYDAADALTAQAEQIAALTSTVNRAHQREVKAADLLADRDAQVREAFIEGYRQGVDDQDVPPTFYKPKMRADAYLASLSPAVRGSQK